MCVCVCPLVFVSLCVFKAPPPLLSPNALLFTTRLITVAAAWLEGVCVSHLLVHIYVYDRVDHSGSLGQQGGDDGDLRGQEVTGAEGGQESRHTVR